MHAFVFLRHAESQGNAQGYLQGQIDSPLSEQGKSQAAALAERWKALGLTFDHLICSPLLRARQTASPIAKALGMQIEIEPLWKERSFGELEGIAFAEINQLQPPVDFFAPFIRVGQTGESQVDLYLRACQALQKLVNRPQGRYLIVAHGSILNKTMFAVLGITPQGHGRSTTFHFDNMSYAHLTYDAASLRWRWIGFTSPGQWDGSLEVK